jgi:type II secretory pathway pseudopilin PulG
MGAEIAAIAIIGSLASAGISYYGQQQQAASAQRMAQYNYSIQRQQMEMQARMQSIAADQQYQAGMQNAKTMENEGLRVEQEARERARRMRTENERLAGAQRARFGKAGVVMEGTPLMVMAESAGLMELAVADELYKANNERSAFYRKAEVEKWQAGYSLIDQAAADYNAATSTFRAQPILMEGQNTAQALRVNSYGSLISGVSGAANMGVQYNFKNR